MAPRARKPSLSFPVMGGKTLAAIDDVLMKLGVTVHYSCGASNCTTTSRYHWTRGLILDVIKAEVDATARAFNQKPSRRP